MSFDFARTCSFLTGPTASGKTAMALRWSIDHNAEIISMDSAAIYRYMDIGTAKPTASEQASVRHHMLDVADPWEEFSVGRYVEMAQRCAEEILSRGRQVLFVGGTPMYLKVLLRGLFDGPPADASIRARLESQANERGKQYLHDRLAECDPVSAARLHVNDLRRVVRAMEVFELTGRPLSKWQNEHEKPVSQNECRVWVISPDRAVLTERIRHRVDGMLQQGLVEEVQRILDFGKPLSMSASQAVGYRETIDYLTGQLTDLEVNGGFVHGFDALKESICVHTCQLAKRQMTWFRGLQECRFVDLI